MSPTTGILAGVFLLVALYCGIDPFKHSAISGFPEFKSYKVDMPDWSLVPTDKDPQNLLQKSEIKFLNQIQGPESMAFDGLGRGPYTGVADGRILFWDGQKWKDFAYTSNNRSGNCDPKPSPLSYLKNEHICGRPLGLRFDKKTGDLFIADAYFGLMKVGPEGGLATSLTTEAEGVPLRFTNDLDIDDEGNIYFTDSSTVYQRRNFLQLVFSSEDSGRVLKYNPSTKETTVLVKNLQFPNGLSLSMDGSFFVFCEGSPGKGREFVAVEQPVEAFTNILFSSGTTGEPKAIPWSNATPLKAAADGWCHLDIRKGDVVAWPTNLGWMMGPWLVYASLLNGASIALYNGSPLSTGFAKFVQDAKVTMLGVIPSIVRSWKSANCTAGYDWSTIRCFGSTGEASSVDEYLWLMGRAQYKPVVEYCGGTEIGGGFVTGSLLQPQSLAAFSTPAMGCSLFILGENGEPIPKSEPAIGELALGPLMFGSSSILLNADHHKVYFHGMPIWEGKILRRHGDFFERTSKGYYRAHGRADDTMNLGGIKVSSVEIERICNSVDSNILETAAIGVPPPQGGPERLVIAVVFKDQSRPMDLDQLRMSFNSAVQKKLNPFFRVSRVVPLSSLPRTASNKVIRRVLRQRLAKMDQNSKL